MFFKRALKSGEFEAGILGFVFCRQSETNGAGGQQYSGNKPPLISGTPILVNGNGNGKSQLASEQNGQDLSEQHHKNFAENVSAFYRISFHLFGKSWCTLIKYFQKCLIFKGMAKPIFQVSIWIFAPKNGLKIVQNGEK